MTHEHYAINQIHTSVFASSSLVLGSFIRVGFHAFSVSRSFTSSFSDSVICITGLLPFTLPCWLFLFVTGCCTQYEGNTTSVQNTHFHRINNRLTKQLLNTLLKLLLLKIYLLQTNAAYCNKWCYCFRQTAFSVDVVMYFQLHHSTASFSD